MVVLANGELDWHVNERRNKYVLCAPVFSFKNRHSQELIIRTQAFDLPNWFYLPPSADGCPYESAIRFEFIQPITTGYTAIPLRGTLSNAPVALSEQARSLLLVHLLRFLGIAELLPSIGQIINDIKDYHDLLIEQLSPGD